MLPTDLLIQAALDGDVERLTRLVADGNDIHAYDELGMTPLLWAVFIGDPQTLNLLLGAGADPNKPSKDGTTPLWHAIDDFGLIEVAAILRRFGAADSSRRPASYEDNL